MTRPALGKLIDLHHHVIYRYERALNKFPAYVFMRMCAALGVDPCAILKRLKRTTWLTAGGWMALLLLGVPQARGEGADDPTPEEIMEQVIAPHFTRAEDGIYARDFESHLKCALLMQSACEGSL